MLQILSHTPVWVFALFAGLLGFGLLQTRSREVRRPLAYALPAGMVALSLSGVQSSFGLTLTTVTAWTSGLIVVTLIVSQVFPDKRLALDSADGTFHIPGSLTPLAVMMAIFFTKYAYAVLQGLGAAAATSDLAAPALSLAYGCFSGYFCARAVMLGAAARRLPTADIAPA
jgi:hypothetical protein